MFQHFLNLYVPIYSSFFFFNDTATTEIYTLSLHDALPIYLPGRRRNPRLPALHQPAEGTRGPGGGDRKSTRLNSSHVRISYAVFCLKKKKKKNKIKHLYNKNIIRPSAKYLTRMIAVGVCNQ